MAPTEMLAKLTPEDLREYTTEHEIVRRWSTKGTSALIVRTRFTKKGIPVTSIIVSNNGDEVTVSSITTAIEAYNNLH